MDTLATLWSRAKCLVLGHDWAFTGRDGDWLDGAQYGWVCKRPACRGKTMTTQPAAWGD